MTTDPISLYSLNTNLTDIILHNPLSSVMYSLAIKVFGYVILFFSPVFSNVGWFLLIGSLAIDAKIVVHWASFQEHFLQSLDDLIEIVEAKVKEIVNSLWEICLSFATQKNAQNPTQISQSLRWPFSFFATLVLRPPQVALKNEKKA